MFDESKCRCSWPNARPPCGYCENYNEEGDMDDDEWYNNYNDFNDLLGACGESEKLFQERLKLNAHKVTAKATKMTEAEMWKKKYFDLTDALVEYKKEVKKDLRKVVYEEELEEMHSYARSEVYANLTYELRDTVYQAEIADIRKKLWDEAREELLAQARKEVLRQIEEAKDKI